VRSIEVLAGIDPAGDGMTSKATRDCGARGDAALGVDTHAADSASSTLAATGRALSINVAASS